jgi:hypothetical protein
VLLINTPQVPVKIGAGMLIVLIDLSRGYPEPVLKWCLSTVTTLHIDPYPAICH